MRALKRKTLIAIDKGYELLGRAFIDRSAKKTAAVADEVRMLNKRFNGNTTPAMLYNYYVNICQIPSWDLTDDSKIAKQLGLSVRKVSDTRRLLQKEGWIKFHTHMYNGIKYGLWFIGRAVVQYRITKESTIEDFKELGLIIPQDSPQGMFDE